MCTKKILMYKFKGQFIFDNSKIGTSKAYHSHNWYTYASSFNEQNVECRAQVLAFIITFFAVGFALSCVGHWHRLNSLSKRVLCT